MKYKLRKNLVDNAEALRLTAQSLLMDLDSINVDELTTFELHFLHAFAENSPDKRFGTEWPKG